MTDEEKKELQESIDHTIESMQHNIEELHKQADEIEDGESASKANEPKDGIGALTPKPKNDK